MERKTGAIIREARQTVADLTDGRKLTPLDMLKLGHARRSLAQLADRGIAREA